MKILEFKRFGIGIIAEFHGILSGFPNQGVWCYNQPYFLTLHPSSIEIDFVSLNILTTIASCPSFWIVLEHWSCL
jgi:hypothetical protein